MVRSRWVDITPTNAPGFGDPLGRFVAIPLICRAPNGVRGGLEWQGPAAEGPWTRTGLPAHDDLWIRAMCLVGMRKQHLDQPILECWVHRLRDSQPKDRSSLGINRPTLKDAEHLSGRRAEDGAAAIARS